jgi:CheY-like chemotaxis protein
MASSVKGIGMEYSKPAVLVVDDEGDVLKLICESLAEKNLTCDTASNAEEALTKLEKQLFKVALLDIGLPGMSGMELLKRISNCPESPVIIMITGMNNIETAVEAMKLGASDYLVKPFTLDRLNDSISSALEKRWREQNSAIYTLVQGMGGSNRDEGLPGGIEAIAEGVDAIVDQIDRHSQIVTKSTTDLAVQLGLPEDEIENWAVARHNYYSERHGRIKSALQKLERNPIAQVILGLTRLVYQNPATGRAKET